MNTAHSSNQRTHEYQPTIIESRVLIRRLATQLAILREEMKQGWIDCNRDPITFIKWSIQDLFNRFRKLLAEPNVVPSLAAALVTVACLITIVLLVDRSARAREHVAVKEEENSYDEIFYMEVHRPANSIGRFGQGRVGFNSGSGEGSGPTQKQARGGGGGGDKSLRPPQFGKLPPPSNVFAAIPATPPEYRPSLPAAGIDIDPALWQDLKAPVFGDPRSLSPVESKGPGEGDGIGSGKGLGVGEGDGPGVGPGKDGNIGDGTREQGCCGEGGGIGGGRSGVLSVREVEQRARLISKPEPKYTEEARRNQITGTVMLRAVFASSGEVVQIRALSSLPFGLTERAIAAAREIKFVPAMKGGRPVSVSMQLEYNFNLY
jgi:TonB family protein